MLTQQESFRGRSSPPRSQEQRERPSQRRDQKAVEEHRNRAQSFSNFFAYFRIF